MENRHDITPVYASRRTNTIIGYACTICGERDITKLLPTPERRLIDPNEIEVTGELDPAKVREYKHVLQWGDGMPPVIVNSTTGKLWNGRHRTTAAQHLGIEIEAFLIPAEWFRVGMQRMVDFRLPLSAFGLWDPPCQDAE